MVGLSVILEEHKDINKRISQVISKWSFCMKIKSPSTPHPPIPSSPCPFSRRNIPINLDECLLCKKKLLPGKDIYMYKGDMGFCSVECRCRQISMDEEESARSGCTSEYKYCSLFAMKPQQMPPSPSSSYSSSGKGSRNMANTFVYRMLLLRDLSSTFAHATVFT
ncbi:Hypothetical predicted protein [Olea europaea subsp. europaea]|uniref:FLZ-type domain-containing protein n=1 Tax=Olea europaea subsp. europaea TaxID=158383 RepID=A0A8S0S2T4_OLEEU|nr:Hypothetical predicted protein [Olea europaea subsp. europaea]